MATLLITDLNFIRPVYQQLEISMMFWCLVILKKNLNPVFSFTEREACYLKVLSNSSNHDNSGLMLQKKRLDSKDSISSRLPAPPPSPILIAPLRFGSCESSCVHEKMKIQQNRGLYTVYCSKLYISFSPKWATLYYVVNQSHFVGFINPQQSQAITMKRRADLLANKKPSRCKAIVIARSLWRLHWRPLYGPSCHLKLARVFYAWESLPEATVFAFHLQTYESGSSTLKQIWLIFSTPLVFISDVNSRLTKEVSFLSNHEPKLVSDLCRLGWKFVARKLNCVCK